MQIKPFFRFAQILLSHAVFLLIASFALACNEKQTIKETSKPKNVTQSAPLIDTNLLVLDTVAIDTFLANKKIFAEFKEDFKSFYATRKNRYAWFDSKGLIEAAQHLAGHIRFKETDGLLRQQAYVDSLLSLMKLQQTQKLKPLLALELMLTAQYFSYAKDRWGGATIAKAKDIGWYLPSKKLSYSQLLAKQLTVASNQIEQEAVIPQYIALRKMLNHYQKLEKEGEDVLVEDSLFKGVKIGDTLASLIELRKRLFQLGDLQQVSTATVYDQQLADAVFSFKKRHGIKPDFSINTRFLKALNVPLRERIKQMMINLERMRWIPLGDHGSKFILINIPAYQLYFYEDEKLAWTCKVVVGKEMSQTVIFGGSLQYVVFSPYWYVPQSIIKKEIAPAMKKDPSYLDRHRMEWNNGHVRQKPGANNSLGLVKFIFPNANDIYLHDTPSKPLFNEDVRAFSHGCIRVEEPKELAKRLLYNLPKWNTTSINSAMKAGKEQWVPLKTKVPVYIGYFTAYVDSEGQLNFRDDIYRRDERLLDMLMQ